MTVSIVSGQQQKPLFEWIVFVWGNKVKTITKVFGNS